MSSIVNLPEQAGFHIKDWCPAVGISKSKYYILSPEERPRTVQLGGQIIITESPRDYLDRMAAQQEHARQA